MNMKKRLAAIREMQSAFEDAVRAVVRKYPDLTLGAIEEAAEGLVTSLERRMCNSDEIEAQLEKERREGVIQPSLP